MEIMERDKIRDAEVASNLEGMVEEYLRRLHERRGADVRRGMARRAEAGLHSSRVPIGYRRVWKDGEFIIEADPAQAPLVHQAFHLAATGKYSARKLHAELVGMGLQHSDGRIPSVSGIFRMLANPFYLGLVKRGDELLPGKHPAIISREAFGAASFKNG